MRQDINITAITGRLTRDFELKYTNSGFPVGQGSIAVNERKKDQGEWIDYASFFDFKLSGKITEGLAQYLTKGKQIAIDGHFRQERWNDKNSGETRSRVFLIANNIQLLGNNSGTGGGGSRPNNRGNDYQNRNRVIKDSDTKDFEDDIPF